LTHNNSNGTRALVLAAAVLLLIGSRLAGAQTPLDDTAASISRTAEGRPDLSGIWQSFTTANWNILAHSAETGPHDGLMGVWSAQRGGLSIVEGNEIPYLPWAAEKQKENYANRMVINVTNDPSRFDTGDPEIQCFRAGVPRANYMPFPFQIVQTPEQVFMIYEYKGAYREINMDSDSLAPNDTWMGWSNGRWEGDTLVVDVTGFNGYTWFDRTGNFHSEALHVVERWTPLSPYHVRYEATIEDPNVFTRPWTMSFTLYKHIDPSAQLIEFNCVPFAEELMYEPLGLFGR